MAAVKTDLEVRLYAALKRISKYQTPASLRRFSSRDVGLDGDEAIEMAYENVIDEAKWAIRGIRAPKNASST